MKTCSEIKSAMAVALLALAAIFSVAIAADARGHAPAHHEAVTEVQATALQKRLETALDAGDATALRRLLADDATIVYISEYPFLRDSKAVDFSRRVLTSSKFVEGFALTGLRDFDGSTRKIVLRDGSFVASIVGTQQVFSGSFCSGICVQFGPYVAAVLTTVWTETAAGWRVTFLEVAPVEVDFTKILGPRPALMPQLKP